MGLEESTERGRAESHPERWLFETARGGRVGQRHFMYEPLGAEILEGLREECVREVEWPRGIRACRDELGVLAEHV